MDNSTVVIILTLSHRLRKSMTTLANENSDWMILSHCLLEWSVQQFVSRKPVELIPIFKDLYERFLKEHEEEFFKVRMGYGLQKAEWKDDTVWLHFANRDPKHFPDWTIINGLKIPDVNDKTIEGVVVYHPKDSAVYYSEVSRMPRHAVVQTEEFLRLGIHSSKVLQNAFDATPINLLASRFLLVNDHEKCWAVSKGFSMWWKDTRQGYPTVTEDQSDDYGQERKTKPVWRDKFAESRQKPKSKNPNNPDYKRRVKVGKKEYQNAFKCSQGESIQPREVYARCYSKRPEWAEWNFI